MTEAEKLELMARLAAAIGHIAAGHYLLAECALSSAMAEVAPVAAAQVAATHARLYPTMHTEAA